MIQIIMETASTIYGHLVCVCVCAARSKQIGSSEEKRDKKGNIGTSEDE